MRMDLHGKVAVVTGASGGIGSATARRLAEAGGKVVVGYNNRAEEAKKVVATLTGGGHRAARMPMEDTAALREVAAMVERDYGRCDVLVNSAGFTRMIPHADLDALTDELIDAIFVANVRGPFATIRAFAPLMKRSDAAVIVNISSAAALSGGGSNIAYGGSKAAIDAMTKSLARVLGPNIRVLSVSPGAVDTGFVPGRTTDMVERAAQRTPLKRVVQADEVAQTVMAAVTLMTATTGTVLLVEAGSLLA
jgi:3-oxoacyl-[acyl-carrier protein] reductase